jgi:hypothetical protein
VRALAFLVFLAACGGKVAAPPAPEPKQPVAEKPAPLTEAQHLAALQDLARRGCECEEPACVLAVDAELAEVIAAVPVGQEVKFDNTGVEAISGFLVCLSQLASDKNLASYQAFVGRMSEVADAACACKDVACTDHAFGGLLIELVAFVEYYGDDPALSNAIKPEMDRAEQCVAPFRDAVADQAIAELTTLRDAACACADAACADKVGAEFDAFLARHTETKGNQQQAETIGAIASEMQGCLAKAKGETAP